MDIYITHPATREYIGPSLADPDPLQPDSWLIPAHAYVDAPPAPPTGYSVRRTEDASAWDFIQDNRGTIYSTETGIATQYDELGPIPNGFTTQPRPSEFHNWSGAAWVLDAAAERASLSAAIDTERDRRIDSGLQFQGVTFQSRATDRENIAGAAQLAFMAVVAGVQPGDLRWSNADADFAWIASDNSLVPMDAQTVVAFGKAAAERKQALIFAARQLKEMASIPANYTDDSWWP